MANKNGLMFPGIITALVGLGGTYIQNPSGPIMIALGIILVITDIFKNKKHSKPFYSVIVGIILAIMFILEYFLVPMQNTIFYALLLIMSIGAFLGFHFAFVSKDHSTRMEKILSWTGMGLFGISLLGLLGFISNDYTLALIMGSIVLIIVGIGFLARKKGLGETA